MTAIRLFAIGILLCSIRGLFALDPATQIAQYAHTAWRLQDGLLSVPPTAIAQTKDGYIWIGTEGGLLRFDGVRFSSWEEATQQPPLKISVTALRAASDGTLWIGANGGLEHWDGKQLTRFDNKPYWVENILEAPNGAIWVLRGRVNDDLGPLCRVLEKQLQCFGTADGIPNRVAVGLAADRSGDIWFGNIDQLIHYRPGRSEVFPVDALKRQEGPAGISSVDADPRGGLWVGFSYAGPGLGLQHFQDGKFESIHTSSIDSSKITINRTLVDRDGAFWIGTLDDGVYRIAGGRIEHYRSSDGLSSDAVNDLIEDQEGDVWVVTTKGLDRFRALSVTTYSSTQGLINDNVASLLANRDGSIWVPTFRGLSILRNDAISSIDQRTGLPGRQGTSILQDHIGRVWLGIDNGLYLVTGGRYIPITGQDKGELGVVRNLAESKDGTVWINAGGSSKLYLVSPSAPTARPSSVQPGLLRKLIPDVNSGVWIVQNSGVLLHVEHGPNGEYENALNTQASTHSEVLQGPDGTLYQWSNGSVILIRGKETRTVPDVQREPCRYLDAWIFDNSENLWLAGHCGLTRIDKDEVRQWWTAPTGKQHDRLVLDTTDGFNSSQGVFSPKAVRSADGKLWFASESGLLSLDPSHLAQNPRPPPVFIEDLIADHHRASHLGNVQLAVHTRDLEIDYTALSLAAPQKVLFRYKLENHDPSWQEAGTRRQAFYNDLAPGHYSFHVIACNNSSIWNDQGATLNFTIPPAWYQTLWFRSSSLLAVLCFGWGLYLLRMHGLQREMRYRFEVRMSERMRIAREVHDTLLQSIQGLMLSFSSFIDQASAPPKVRQGMESALDHAEELLVSGRDRIHDLRSDSSPGKDLVSQMAPLINRFSDGEDLKAKMTITGESRELRPAVLEEVRWILTEAFSNACRHSGAKEIELDISYTRNGLECSVKDNGRGFDQDNVHGLTNHFGLIGMYERAERIGGRLDVETSSGIGTTVVITVPSARAYSDDTGWVRRLYSILR